MLAQSWSTHTLSSIDPERLDCPFSASVNPHALTVQRQNLEWLESTGIKLEGSLFQDVSEVGWLAAHVYPTATPETLQLAADWTSLFFLLDDLVEEATSEDAIRLRNERVLSALTSSTLVVDEPVFRALRDVGGRARALGGEAFMGEFSREVARWLDSHLWEHDNRSKRRVPPLEEYRAMRNHTVGMYFEFLLSEVTDSYRLSTLQRVSREVLTLTRMASNEIAWTNDILTLEKELAQGDVHNLVLSIMEGQALPLEEAIDEAVLLHNREVAAFSRLALALRSAPSTHPSLRQLIQALENWMGGHTRWARESKRYGGSRPPRNHSSLPSRAPESNV
jgi:hypothetical protein